MLCVLVSFLSCIRKSPAKSGCVFKKREVKNKSVVIAHSRSCSSSLLYCSGLLSSRILQQNTSQDTWTGSERNPLHWLSHVCCKKH